MMTMSKAFTYRGRGVPTIYDHMIKYLYPTIDGPNGRRSGLMVSALDSGLSASGMSPGRGHCVVFLDKVYFSHSASLHPGVEICTDEIMLGGLFVRPSVRRR